MSRQFVHNERIQRTWTTSPRQPAGPERDDSLRLNIGRPSSRHCDARASWAQPGKGSLRDAELAVAMGEHGLVIVPQAVVGQLLDELRQDAGR